MLKTAPLVSGQVLQLGNPRKIAKFGQDCVPLQLQNRVQGILLPPFAHSCTP